MVICQSIRLFFSNLDHVLHQEILLDDFLYTILIYCDSVNYAQ